MIKFVVFLDRWRCFDKGSVIDFRHGVNLIVGDQGCGKSTLLGQLGAYAEKGAKGHKRCMDPCHVTAQWEGPVGRVGFFDSEKFNPRTAPGFDMGFGYDADTQIASLFMSHGQSSLALLPNMSTLGPNCLFLDEPDTALSPRSIRVFAEDLATVKDPGQVIASVHNPLLIASVDEVLSLEHRRWMSSEEFLASQAKDPAPKPFGPDDRVRYRIRYPRTNGR